MASCSLCNNNQKHSIWSLIYPKYVLIVAMRNMWPLWESPVDGRWIAFIKAPLIKKSVILSMFGDVFKHMVSISGAKMANTCFTFWLTFLILITSCKKKAVRDFYYYFFFNFTALIIWKSQRNFTRNVKLVSGLPFFFFFFLARTKRGGDEICPQA